MNILIPLGNGSRWLDNELRYCLRSIEQHLQGWEKLVLVGRMPAWMQVNERLHFIPMADKPGDKNKEENIHLKTMAGINSGVLGNDFLFMNDDHFLLQDIDACQFPYHHKGPLKETLNKTSRWNSYRVSIENTLTACPGNAANFDTHAPIIYHAESYRQKVDCFVFPPYGFCLKTLYCYHAGIEGEYYPDCKLATVDDIDSAIDGRLYFSIGNKAIGPQLETYLQKIYPKPSMFEKVAE